MKTATVYVEIFNVVCPHCDEPVSGENGGYSISHATNAPPELRAGGTWPCEHCGRVFRLPIKTTY